MFGKHYEARLLEWQAFRNETLSNSSDVITDVIELYQKAPKVSIHTDPYSQQTWPGPWELILENKYCDFCKILGICYTLQLTESFKDSNFEIYIGIDRKNHESYYLLSVNNNVIGFNDNYIHISSLPTSIAIERNYLMPELH
jgi:hypothetical protein|tara:strand:+ start:707 stop:1132 length:426 start_codon:yes stop_codon:yes gene_type:complete